MSRIYNFSAGPSVLPEEVLKTAASEMLEYRDSGMSVMEMSHRSKVYISIFEDAMHKLREVMNIPETYHVLFLQGGASTQFSMIPMNLMVKNGRADYVVTGSWAEKACKEGGRFGEARIAASSKDVNFSRIPKQNELDLDPKADYLHICENNTIYGTAFPYIPENGDVPLVADFSSCILSKPVDVSRYGLIYAGAQKNMGPAGLTVVIVREDLVGKTQERTPTMLDYMTHVKADSMYNTPPTYGAYILGLVLDWIIGLGGVEAMAKINREKASLLYDYLDESTLFTCPVEKGDRSLMNITFVTGKEDLDAKFVADAKKQGFENLKGHRSVGGMRASIYNAMPTAGVKALVEFMREFERNN